MADENTVVTSNAAQEPEDEQVQQNPLVGKTSRWIYSLTLLVSFAVVAVMFVFIARGSIAVAASLPGSFQVTADSISGTGFSLTSGLDPQGQPVGVATFQSATIVNQVITKTISVLGHTITVNISSTGNSTATNLVTDVFSQTAGTATLTNLKLTNNSGTPESITQTADSATLGSNVTINSPFLSASSITIPGLSISISIS